MEYNDKKLYLFGIPMMGILYRHFGEPASLVSLLSSSIYYLDLLVCILASAVLWMYNRNIILQLDKRYPWEKRLAPRILLTLLYCHLFSFVFIIIVDFLYNRFAVGRTDAKQLATIISYDASAILLLVTLIHLLYAFLNLRYKLNHSSTRDAASAKSTRRSPIRTILAEYGKSKIPVAVEHIACFEKTGTMTLLRTIDDKEYVVDHTLEALQDLLADNRFYRINRQVLASLSSISSVENDLTGKLNLSICKKAYYVSRKKSTDFLQWMQNN